MNTTATSSSILQTFDFKENPVRALERDGQPWFVAADVCRVLELANARDAISSLHEDEKDGVGITDAIGRQQITNCINESGLYALIFKSRKPQAQAFRKWVTSEVLPTLRKTGHYQTPAPSSSTPPLDYDRFPVCKDFFEIFNCLREQQVEPNESCSAALRLVLINLKVKNKLKLKSKGESNNSVYEQELESLVRLFSMDTYISSASASYEYPFLEVVALARRAGVFHSILGDELTPSTKSAFGLLLSKHDGDLIQLPAGAFRFTVKGSGRGRFYCLKPII